MTHPIAWCEKIGPDGYACCLPKGHTERIHVAITDCQVIEAWRDDEGSPFHQDIKFSRAESMG